jgi:hypothetical protein
MTYNELVSLVANAVAERNHNTNTFHRCLIEATKLVAKNPADLRPLVFVLGAIHRMRDGLYIQAARWVMFAFGASINEKGVLEEDNCRVRTKKKENGSVTLIYRKNAEKNLPPDYKKAFACKLSEFADKHEKGVYEGTDFNKRLMDLIGNTLKREKFNEKDNVDLGLFQHMAKAMNEYQAAKIQ